ncbi:MAG: hypothetical protein IT323_06780 [Anaerolineae bacterium]|nr:hypothetical protein [Anaerolineae bacterium]
MIERARHVSILYSASLNGQIDLLPRLFTQLKHERASADPARAVVLVDLGQSCRADAPPCALTGGRAMLVAMDAMGYDAFHIGALDMLYAQPALVAQLRNIVMTRFAAGPWYVDVKRRDALIRLVNAQQLDPAAVPGDEDADLVVGLRLADAEAIRTEYTGRERLLWLQGAASDAHDRPTLGRVDVTLTPDAPFITLDSSTRLPSEGQYAPDPTISGVVDFVLSEARAAGKR